ncbi:MAG: hypothetical protein P4L33_11475 [Capsulimonadaceae bacterium]|nr:hypothetical protein [Capsulimonadaceae bacterium]
MRLRWIAALAVSAAVLPALVLGTGKVAGADEWHHGHGHAYDGGPGRYYEHGGGWHHRTWYHRGPGPMGYSPGPGYTWYTWDWYYSHPHWWRVAHPYHGGASVGVWIRL